jgi:hypothetical protein
VPRILRWLLGVLNTLWTHAQQCKYKHPSFGLTQFIIPCNELRLTNCLLSYFVTGRIIEFIDAAISVVQTPTEYIHHCTGCGKDYMTYGQLL